MKLQTFPQQKFPSLRYPQSTHCKGDHDHQTFRPNPGPSSVEEDTYVTNPAHVFIHIKSASNVIYLYCDSDSVCGCISVYHGTGERQVNYNHKMDQSSNVCISG